MSSPFADPRCPRNVVKKNCDLWLAVVGHPLDEATRRARAAGYTRTIDVRTSDDFDPACKAGTVCGMTPTRWELNDGDVLTLWVNRGAAISRPD
ncbi:MAG TPA: PASTA domain-containing protein [Kofleriaceae bacterium]